MDPSQFDKLFLKFDHLFPKFDHLFALNDRMEAVVNPLGKMREGLNAAMRMQQLAGSLVGPKIWLDNVGLADSLAVSRRMTEAFNVLSYPTLNLPNLPDLTGLGRLTALGPAMPPAVATLMANMELVQGSFFKNWSGLAAAAKPPGWLRQMEAMQTRFDHLLANLAGSTEPKELGDFGAQVALSAEVFTLGSEVLADPAAVSTSQFQTVLATITAFLAQPALKEKRDWLAWLFACLMFIGWLRDEWQKMQPAVATVGEVAIQQELVANRTQMALAQALLARQHGELSVAHHPIWIYSRPASKAPKTSLLPAETELTVTGRVRTWVQVSCFDAEGILLQGWVQEAQLQPFVTAPVKKPTAD